MYRYIRAGLNCAEDTRFLVHMQPDVDILSISPVSVLKMSRELSVAISISAVVSIRSRVSMVVWRLALLCSDRQLPAE